MGLSFILTQDWLLNIDWKRTFYSIMDPKYFQCSWITSHRLNIASSSPQKTIVFVTSIIIYELSSFTIQFIRRWRRIRISQNIISKVCAQNKVWIRNAIINCLFDSYISWNLVKRDVFFFNHITISKTVKQRTHKGNNEGKITTKIRDFIKQQEQYKKTLYNDCHCI